MLGQAQDDGGGAGGPPPPRSFDVPVFGKGQGSKKQPAPKILFSREGGSPVCVPAFAGTQGAALQNHHITVAGNGVHHPTRTPANRSASPVHALHVVTAL